MCATSHVRHTGQRSRPRAAGARPVRGRGCAGWRCSPSHRVSESRGVVSCCRAGAGAFIFHRLNESQIVVSLSVPASFKRTARDITSYDAPTATRIHDVNMTSTHFLAGPRSTCVGALENARVAESLRPEASIRYACHEAKEPSAPMSGLRRGSPALLREEATAAKRMPFLMVLGACDRLRRVGLTRGEQGAAPPRGE